MDVEVTRTYLQLERPEDLKPARVEDPRVRIEPVVDCPPSFFRYLYAEVGRAYRWVDRLSWTDGDIRAHLADPGVSRYHCWILFRDGAPSVEDLASANGTFVNGERIRVRMALKPGDVIRVGSTEIQVSEEENGSVAMWMAPPKER